MQVTMDIGFPSHVIRLPSLSLHLGSSHSTVLPWGHATASKTSVILPPLRAAGWDGSEAAGSEAAKPMAGREEVSGCEELVGG